MIAPAFRPTWFRASLVLVGALVSLELACSRTAPKALDPPLGPAWFRDVTAEVGLDFVHDAGPVGDYFLPQIIGSGAALFDFNNDGRLDLYLIQNGGPQSVSTNRLFRQEADGRFTDVSAGSGLNVAGHGMGAAVADIDNDGFPDLLLTEYGRLRLFRNNGNGSFTDISRSAGLESTLWGTSASFLDFDRDGWLDLVVVNYLDYDHAHPCFRGIGQRDYCHPSEFAGTVTRLYRNLGVKDGTVRFEDVTEKAGLGRSPGPGLGVVCADFDDDGWIDIFVANDNKANRLWMNQRNGTFKDEAVPRGLAYNGMGQALGNMGVALGDVDGDGRFDLFVTHLVTETNTLWKQRAGTAKGLFQDHTVQSGLGQWRGTGWGTVLADFDRDGALDIAVVNGRIFADRPAASAARLGPHWSRYAEQNFLLANDGRGNFRDLSRDNPDLCGSHGVYRGLAVGDLDNDGALDLVVTGIAGPARVFRNVAPERGHWLMVRAVDPALRRDACGARITVEAGTRRWVQWINPAHSFLCSNDPRAHFGLGSSDRIDALHVRWPDGAEEVFPALAADQLVVLRKGEGRKPAR